MTTNNPPGVSIWALLMMFWVVVLSCICYLVAVTVLA